MPSSKKAYQATVASSSAVIDSTYDLSYRGSKTTVSVTTMGPFSWSQDLGEFAVSDVVSGSAIKAEQGSTFTSEEIVDGNETYSTTSTTGLPANLVGPGGWTETTWRGRSAGSAQGFLDFAFFGLGTPGGGMNPEAIVGLLRNKETSVEMVGHTVLAGVETSHFRSSIPFSRLGAVGPDATQLKRDLGTKFLRVDYWTDSSDRLRLLQFGLKVMHLPATATTTRPRVASGSLLPITASVQLELSDYGTTVSVAPPPASRITSRTTCEVTSSGFSC